QRALQLPVGLERLFQATPALQNFLGCFLVLPEVRADYLFLDGLEFAAAGGGVKENSGVRRRGFSVLGILGRVLRSFPLLRASVQVPGVRFQVSGYTCHTGSAGS